MSTNVGYTELRDNTAPQPQRMGEDAEDCLACCALDCALVGPEVMETAANCCKCFCECVSCLVSTLS